MEKQKLRSEIEDKYKWELESIYKNEKEFKCRLKVLPNYNLYVYYIL